jgi:outer membrane protein TolC
MPQSNDRRNNGRRRAVVIALMVVGMQIATCPVQATTDKPWYLQEQYEKSKQLPNDSLLSPLPQTTPDGGIKVSTPDEVDLVPLGNMKLHPLRLEATISRPVTLQEVLEQAVENNLAIKVSMDTLKSNRSFFVSSLGKFLPDLSMTYKVQDMYQQGNLITQFKTGAVTLAYAFFQGGKVYAGAAASYFNYRAARFSLSANKNDILLGVYRLYNSVLYNQALLHIKVKSLESSRAALSVTEQQYRAGTGTKYAVMQSKSQVASDMQALVSQESALRKANIDLSAALNRSLFENYVPREIDISKKQLVNPRLNINEAVSIAMANRPEIRQYDALRKQASATARQQASPLLPTAQIFFTPTNTTTYTPSANSSIATSTSSVNLSTSGAGTTSVGLGNAVGASVSLGGTLNWNLSGLGVTDSASLLAYKNLAHRAVNQYNQQVLTVMQELHKSYIDVQTAEQQIEITGENVEAARESLRLAFIRLKVGNGTNLEYIQSQKSYVDALTTQVRAFVDYLNAQAQLLRDIGTINPTILANGYTDRTGNQRL